MTLSATRAASIIHLPIAMVLLGGCAPTARLQYDKDAIAEAIESRIELPEGAGPLDSYGRNYAFADNGTVVAVFVAPHWPTDAKAGQSLWHDSDEDLPVIMDGGCSVISVSYNPETENLSAVCNGVA